MTGKNATPLIGWHSADPALKPWIDQEAQRRGITRRELLDEALSEYRERRSDECPHPERRINKGLCGACGTYVGTTSGGK